MFLLGMRLPRRASRERAQAPFLAALNLTNAKGNARPGRERKLRQIFRFAELLDHALARTDVYAGEARLVDIRVEKESVLPRCASRRCRLLRSTWAAARGILRSRRTTCWRGAAGATCR